MQRVPRAAGSQAHAAGACSRLSRRAGRRTTTRVQAHGQWQTFGPSQSHMDGDAEFYSLSDRLAQQHPGFAPTSSIQGEPAVDLTSTSEQDIEEEVIQELRRTRPEFGLSARQINALGLSGLRLNMPDSVSASACVRATLGLAIG